MPNNYDKSSNGVSVDFHCSYDIHIAQSDFQENFKVLKSDGHSEYSVYQYIDYGEEKEIEEIRDLFNFSKCSRKDFRQWCIDNSGDTIEEIISERVKYFDSWEVMFFEMLSDVYDWNSISKNEYDLPKNTEELYFNFDTKGHFQGDFATVLVSWKLVEQYKEGEDTIRNIVYNQAWNTPIYCRIEIEIDKGDEPTQTHEIYVDGEMRDIYSWDKEEALKIIKSNIENVAIPYTEEEKEIVMNFVTEHLPEYPEYH